MADRRRHTSHRRGIRTKKGLFVILCTLVSVSLIITACYIDKDMIWLKTTEVSHVAFLKVHKTASSTVQNMFLRFGESRNLTLILANISSNECDSFPNCISYTKTLHGGNIVPPPRKKSYDMLCSHVIYNREAFRKYLPRDTRYIGLVREPTRRLESAITFFKLFNGSFEQFAENPTKHQHNMTNNRMAFEFGFNTEWFPNASHRILTNLEEVKASRYVDQLMDDFDLIIINERLDESLVLMRRLLRWTVKDVLYRSKLVKRHKHFREEDLPSVKNYLYLDYMLYERAVKLHVAKVSQAGNDFHGEVTMLKSVNFDVNKYCSCEKCMAEPFKIKNTRWYSSRNVTRETCKTLKTTELPYFKKIRAKQYGQ